MKQSINIIIIDLRNIPYLQSHIDEQSDREDDMRDCDSSDEGVNVNVNQQSATSGMDYSRSPDQNNDLIK